MRILIAVLAIAILLPSIAYAEEKFILGVSPASAVTCVAGGSSATLKLLLSTNVAVPENLSIGVSGPDWVKTDRYVYFTGVHDLPVVISVPNGTEEGVYTIKFLICSVAPEIPQGAGAESMACISPYMDVNVSQECMPEEQGAKVHPFGITILVAVAALILLTCPAKFFRKRRKRR